MKKSKTIIERRLVYKLYSLIHERYTSNKVFLSPEMAYKSVKLNDQNKNISFKKVFRIDAVEMLTRVVTEGVHTKNYKKIMKRHEQRKEQDIKHKAIKQEIAKQRLIAMLEREINPPL